jgi:hypothetical protein
MFFSCTVFVVSGRGLCDGPIPRPEESYRLWCVSECDQVKIKTLYTCYEQVGRRGKDYDERYVGDRGRDSAVSVGTCQWLDDLELERCWRQDIFPTHFQAEREFHPASCSKPTGASSRE